MEATTVEVVLAAPQPGVYYVTGAPPALGCWKQFLPLEQVGGDYRAAVRLRPEDFPVEFKSARGD